MRAAPGTSAIHRKPKRPRHSEDAGDTPPSLAHANAHHSTSFAAPQQSRRNDVPVPVGITAATQASPTAASAAALLDGLDPFDLLTDEVKNSYLRCSYKWSFHHTPTLLLRIRDRTLEPWMAWAMLALAIRYVRPACLTQHHHHHEHAADSPFPPLVASSKTLPRPSAPRQRPAMPKPPKPARSCNERVCALLVPQLAGPATWHLHSEQLFLYADAAATVLIDPPSVIAAVSQPP